MQDETTWRRWKCLSSVELVSDGSRVSLKLTAGMPAALSLLCLSRCCVCVHTGTPDGLLRCGWTSINSTTTLRGHQPRERPLAGLSIIQSCSFINLQQKTTAKMQVGLQGKASLSLSYYNNTASKQDFLISVLYILMRPISLRAFVSMLTPLNKPEKHKGAL